VKENMTEKITSFKQLKIWQKGIGIVKKVYDLTKSFPKEELYGLTSQAKRAAVSIPANIAEGFKRYHHKEYRQFLYVAMGSLAELETHLIIAYELKLITQIRVNEISSDLDELSKMTYGLISKLK
jgi:four helix bundle protein